MCHTHLIMSQSVRTKNKPPRTSGLPAGDRVTRLEVRMENVATKADLAAVNGQIGALNEKIDGVKNELNEKIDGVKNELNEKIDGVKNELNEKIDGVKNELSQKIESEVGSLRSEMKAEMEALKAQMQANFVANLKWTLGVLVPFFTLLMTVFKFL